MTTYNCVKCGKSFPLGVIGKRYCAIDDCRVVVCSECAKKTLRQCSECGLMFCVDHLENHQHIEEDCGCDCENDIPVFAD